MPHRKDGGPGGGDYVAALTGDLVGSRRGAESDDDPLHRVGILKEALRATEKDFLPQVISSFLIFRGDSFQGIVRPEDALRAAIVIRTLLRTRSAASGAASALDARIAVGIGDLERLPNGTVAESDGTALRRSGPLLDQMKRKERRLLFATPWTEVDAELNAACGLFDAVVARWSRPQAEAALVQFLRGRTQIQAAEELGVSQPAIAQRLKAASVDAVEAFCARYESLVRGRISHEANTGGL